MIFSFDHLDLSMHGMHAFSESVVDTNGVNIVCYDYEKGIFR